MIEKEKINNKVVIVTGGSRSIGKAISIKLVQMGAKVVVVSRNRKELKNTNHLLSQFGDSMYIVADLTKEKDVKRVFRKVLSRFGGVDILINNAGIITDRLFDLDEREISKSPYKKWLRMQKVNLNSAFLTTQNMIKIASGDKERNIINISSNLEDIPTAGYGSYCCSKAALSMLTKVSNLELKDKGIKVYSYKPKGSVDIKEREYNSPCGDEGRISSEEVAGDFVSFLDGVL